MEFNKLASKESIEKTTAALTEHGFQAIVVESGAEALAKIKELIPAGASVTNGSSRTLAQIGYIDYLKAGEHGWNNLQAAVAAEKDPAKQAILRKQNTIADYYLGSVHALAEMGELLIASASGSQLPPIVFTAKNLIFVVGAQKIVPTLTEGMQRLEEYVFPLEDQRMKEANMGGSIISKVLLFKREPSFMGRTVRVILVNEALGF